jgi:hypothetical protein
MKINEQYHNLNLLENVTYEFLGRDGEAHEETEPILVEHMMNVYVNERLTMKLVFRNIWLNWFSDVSSPRESSHPLMI